MAEVDIDAAKTAIEYNSHDLGEFGKMVRLEYVFNVLDRYAGKAEKPAITVASEVISDYADTALETGFFSTELAHRVLNALAAAGYLSVEKPFPDQPDSCWVRRVAS